MAKNKQDECARFDTLQAGSIFTNSQTKESFIVLSPTRGEAMGHDGEVVVYRDQELVLEGKPPRLEKMMVWLGFTYPFRFGGPPVDRERFEVNAIVWTVSGITLVTWEDPIDNEWRAHEESTGGVMGVANSFRDIMINTAKNIADTPTLKRQIANMGPCGHMPMITFEQVLKQLHPGQQAITQPKTNAVDVKECRFKDLKRGDTFSIAPGEEGRLTKLDSRRYTSGENRLVHTVGTIQVLVYDVICKPKVKKNKS